MDFDFNECYKQYFEFIDVASLKPNYIDKLSNLSCPSLIERESTGFGSIYNRNATGTITNENDDVNMTDAQSIHEGVSYNKDENPFSELIKTSKKDKLKQDFPNTSSDCNSSKNYNLESDMNFEIDCNQDLINKYYSCTEVSNKKPFEPLKEDLMQSETILINIGEKYEQSPKEIGEIENYYRNSKNQQSFRFFSRYSMQKKIKTQFLKFNYNKLLSLLSEKCHFKFPKFNTKKFVDINDIIFEQELFSYPNMKELMKVKDFVTGESIEIFIKKKTNFKDNESYLEFIRIISLDYAGWIKAYLSYCSENYEEAEKKIKINSQKNIDGERKATIMSDYFKLFWKEAKEYINYFRNKSPNSKPVGGRKQAIKAKKV